MPRSKPLPHAARPLPLTLALRPVLVAAAVTAAVTAAAATLAGAARAAPVPARAAAQAGAVLPLRLPEGVRPTAYRLSLAVDPAQPAHRGEVEIEVQLRQPTSSVLLHAKDLRITAAWAEAGAHRLAARVQRRDADRIELRLPRALPAGKAVLGLSFEGTLQDKDVYGLFRQRDDGPGGRWAAFTQFEAVGARLAFPLFDEPGFKVPWSLSLTVPQDLMAVANMPVVSETAAGPGRKRVQFATTPPLPSYLLAFAVGDFAARMVSAPDATTPLRFIVPRGRETEVDYAASITAPVLGRLEAFFDMPYPYAKLDSLAIPVTVNFSAMEHPGLITYGSNGLLAPPGQATAQFRREYVSNAAHELAHQWFGNLVTMAWWDDLWLNESFASWLGDRITAEVLPDSGWDAAPARARTWAMRADRLASARRIEQPVRVAEDMGNLWDAITYEKGQAVLTMAEAWLGPERFRAGVQRYIQRHAWGHATSADFFAALATASPDEAALPAAIRSFTSQPGIPLLRTTLQCGDGAPRLHLAQSRLLPLGSPARTDAMQRWQIPVRVRTPGGNARLLMDGPEATLALPDAGCPAWVLANDGGTGYYRTAYAADGLARLADAAVLRQLSVGELIALVDDAQGLHDAGEIDTAAAVTLVQAAAAHPRREVVEAAGRLLEHLKPLARHPAERSAYAARWQSAFGERARALGWRARPADGDDEHLLRSRLLPWLADLGQDGALREQARALATAWLTDASQLSPDLRQATLSAAALDGDEALFDGLLGALRRSPERAVRDDLLEALGRFRRPALAQRARELLLDPGIDIRDSLRPLLQGQSEDAATRAAALDFVARRLPELGRRLGRDEPAQLPRFFAGCGADEQRRLEQALARAMPRALGGQQALQRALESTALCTAWRERQAAQF